MADLRSAESTDGREGAWRFYILAMALYLCALLSKTSTSLLPVTLLLTLWWKRARLQRRDLLALLPLFLLGLLFGVATMWIETHLKGARGEEFSLSFLERVLVAGRAFWFDLGKLSWPVKLAFIYPRWHLDTAALWQYLFPLAAMALLAALWLARRRIGKAPFAVMLNFVLASPALVLVHVLYMMRYSFVTDHWQYLGSMGVIALAAVAIARVAASVSERQARPLAHARGSEPIASTVVLLLLASLTWRQTHVYRNLEILWRDTLAKNRDCWMAHNNLGTVLHDLGKRDEAMTHYLAALQLKPDSTDGHNNIGLLLADQGKLDEAIAHYREALRLKPDFGEAHGNLAHALIRQKQIPDAINHYRRALQTRPEDVEAHYNLGVALVSEGKMAEAATHFSEALRLQPGRVEAHNNLALILVERGRTEEAIAHYREALRIKPDFAQAHFNLGAALESQGKIEEALSHYREAVRLDPSLTPEVEAR